MILCNIFDIAGWMYDICGFQTYRTYMLPWDAQRADAANDVEYASAPQSESRT